MLTTSFTNPNYIASYSNASADVSLVENGTNGHARNGRASTATTTTSTNTSRITPLLKSLRPKSPDAVKGCCYCITIVFLLALLAVIPRPRTSTPGRSESKIDRIYELLNRSHVTFEEERRQVRAENSRLTWLNQNLTRENKELASQNIAFAKEVQLTNEMWDGRAEAYARVLVNLVEENTNLTDELERVSNSHKDITGLVERLAEEKRRLAADHAQLEKLAVNGGVGGLGGRALRRGRICTDELDIRYHAFHCLMSENAVHQSAAVPYAVTLDIESAEALKTETLTSESVS